MSSLVHHLLGRSAIDAPDKEAVVLGGTRLRYAETWDRVRSLAAGLRKLGVEPGDRVGIFTEPSVSQVLSIFAVSSAGGVFVPVNEVLFPDQIAHIANDCAMKVLITSKIKLETALAASAEAPSIECLVVDSDEKLPAADVATVTFADAAGASLPEGFGDSRSGEDLAALIYTSGSSGRAKGVMASHAQLLAGSSIVSRYLGITREHRTLAALPFSFDAGLNQLMTAMEHGATIVVKPFVFARELVETLVEEEITGMGGVPLLWNLMAQDNSTLRQRELPALRYISNTGGAMPQSTLAALREQLPSTRIFLMYGLTEAFRSTYLPPEELDRRPTSMGKAIPDTEILVVDDDGKRCAAGEVGELVHVGPTVTMGYWNQPELTARIFRPHPFSPDPSPSGERVVYSGDLVRTDEDGFLYFVARRDAMIKTSGFRVSPTEVESALCASPKVRDGAVIGIPHEMLGQTIKAFVVPRDGAVVDPEELIAFCAERIPRHMVPRAIEIVDALPKTGSGKVDYPALRRREGLGK